MIEVRSWQFSNALIARSVVPPFEVTFWRSFFTVLALLVILPLWQGAGVFRRFPWRRGAFWLAGLCWATMFTAFMVALTMTGVARVLVTEEVVRDGVAPTLVSRAQLAHSDRREKSA